MIDCVTIDAGEVTLEDIDINFCCRWKTDTLSVGTFSAIVVSLARRLDFTKESNTKNVPP